MAQPNMKIQIKQQSGRKTEPPRYPSVSYSVSWLSSMATVEPVIPAVPSTLSATIDPPTASSIPATPSATPSVAPSSPSPVSAPLPLPSAIPAFPPASPLVPSDTPHETSAASPYQSTPIAATSSTHPVPSVTSSASSHSPKLRLPFYRVPPPPPPPPSPVPASIISGYHLCHKLVNLLPLNLKNDGIDFNARVKPLLKI